VTQEPSRSGQDPIGDFQRWLVRSGARSVSREVSDQIRSMLGRGGGPADVWAKATAPPADEAHECAWCAFCRAARVLRESGPGMSSQVAAAGEAVGVLARDAVSAFESALAATGRAARAGTGQGQAPSGTVWADVTAEAGETAPEPGEAVPGPEDAVPEPGEAVPGPEDAAPEPGEAVPGPEDAAPEPGEAVPGPEDAVPGPGEEPESAGPSGGPPHGPDDRG
jgi:hypothetical protein